MRAEETSGRAEPVLSTAVGRLRWATSHLAFGLLGPALALLASGVTAGLAYGAAIGDVGGQVPRLIGAAMVQLPAVWLLAGLTIAIFGLFPRLSPVAWAGPAICMLIGFTSAGVQLDEWVRDISPFSHLPQLPGGSASAAPVITLVAIAVVLGAVGLVGLRRRDLPVG
jgi:ABC-2 type transport system permease protein